MPADGIESVVSPDVETLEFSNGSDDLVAQRVHEHGLGFTLEEARSLARLLGRDPTLLEAHLFNTMWSEHCSYKSSKPVLKANLPTDSSFVVLGPVEDAGVVEIGEYRGEKWAVAIGHESHNHPSQVVPYEGAATGIGGITRDVYCMGADVFAVLDSLRFGDLDGPHAERGCEILHGVVDGIAGYANPLGVPNLGGETTFHPGYDDNCLVNVICAGILRVKDLVHSAVPAQAQREPYDLILIGKGTDASGFGGAAMASKVLDEDLDNRSAVQVPDPFLKRVLRNASLAVLELAREKNVPVGFKDLGAGGIACVASEIAHAGGVGVEVDLSRVHLQEEGIPPEVIACAETQERFGWAVPRTFTADVLRIYNEEYELGQVSRGAAASVIGHFLPTEPVMRVLWNGSVVAEAKTDDITAGVVADRQAAAPRAETTGDVTFDGDLHDLGLRVLSSPNIASKRELFSHYDQEVRGGTFFRPCEAGAGVALPIPGSTIGVALSADGNPRYGERHAYRGGACAVAEAVRNVVVTGARPRALTDCLNFGNPEKPEHYRDFLDSVRGLSDAARGIGTVELDHHEPLPFVSGNVSFYNESTNGNAVPPSPIVCCVGVLPDASRAVGVRLQSAGNRILLVGARERELGGSEAGRLLDQSDRGSVPNPDFARERITAQAMLAAIEAGHVASGQDVASGGVFTALAEMMLGSWAHVRLGLDVDLSALGPDDDFGRMFSETGAYLVEIRGDVPAEFAQVPHAVIGTVTDTRELVFRGDKEYRWSAEELEESWGRAFARVME
ncbi:MAG: phosphoribosylformylglycinamidine synthase subunit PurL [Gemmatimonadota bacterium]|nr:MAG: phosphoribosylformylglycinamidine synthase subunit PurL [Gemmatimonadota bacterium]